MENSSKLIVTIIGQNCEKFIDMALESVKDADDILFIDGGSTDKTEEIIRGSFLKYRQMPQVRIEEHKWDPTDKQMNGKQRNFYLNILKRDYPDHWALILDADEIVEDLSKVKGFTMDAQKNENLGAYYVKMRHFIGDLGHEDATRDKHWVPNRLFRIKDAIRYPEHSHPVLEVSNGIGQTDCTTIWHLGHLPVEYMKYIVLRTRQHKEDSVIHEKEFLNWWGQAHLFGQYPTRVINPREIPELIYRHLGIDFEEIYSSQEQIQLKHSIMVHQWNDYFEPDTVLDIGCGRGCYLYFWQWFAGSCMGIDNNKWAIENTFVPGKVMWMDCTNLSADWDLITCIDLLEHLSDSDLDITLGKLGEYGRNFLFSIPFIGDPNLLADKTHKQFKTKEEWIKLIESHGIKIKETPKDWLFANQILIGEK